MANSANLTSLEQDEQAIRHLIATWHTATANGDLPQLLNLMAEDVIFLVPGKPPMQGKEAFSAGFQQAIQHYCIEPSGEIKEIHIAEDWAYCWADLSVSITPLQTGSPMRRTGDVLTILHKQAEGDWAIARDANLLVVEPSTVNE
ncbi:YybH family protein [Pantanalinema sp. GBBB05]|uniref:YybH family protein n=1 Tax=Pantanalinema sp. GBBB05 TaxID=2604139 RepID=UPI001DDFE7EE|nr:SgcJ/EcaC family oxidoreductase [Pantanalinema sp. GBBB05]